MSKLIPQTFITDLLARVDISDIVSARVKLRRTGSNLVGLCPFHNEKTPSFTVSQNKQFFHCFGCGAHGSAISFIMQFEHLNFVEAVENLAAQLGITIPRAVIDNEQSQYNEIYKINERAAAFFEHQLPNATQCINYLKSRGLTGEICKKFRIGYATNDWENLKHIYGSSISVKKHLITAGLLVTKNNKTYARFRNRIMFPIRNVRGNIIGFGGRALGDDPAKYLNSPETIIFHKGEELYGLYEAKKANNVLKSIIVVEGYLDVISLAQFNITNTVATLGTAISTKQVQLLLRNTSEVVFCFDGDQAGRTAAWRALENSLPLMRDGIQIKFLFLPEGDDPDSLIRKELEKGFSKRLNTAMTLADLFFKQLTSEIKLNTIDGRAKLAKIGVAWLKKMPYSIFRQFMTERIAELVNIDVAELKNLEIHPLPVENIDNKSTTDLLIVIKNAISILLHHAQLVNYIDNIEDIRNIKITGIELLLELFSLLKKHPNLSMAAILEYWRGREEFDMFAMLACKKPIISIENLKNEFIGTIQLLKQIEREQTIKTLLSKAATEGLSTAKRQELQNLIAASKK